MIPHGYGVYLSKNKGPLCEHMLPYRRVLDSGLDGVGSQGGASLDVFSSGACHCKGSFMGPSYGPLLVPSLKGFEVWALGFLERI